MIDLNVWAPGASTVDVQVFDGERRSLQRNIERPGAWIGVVPAGARYQLHVDDGGPLVDPLATQVWFAPSHERRQPDAWAEAVAWPEARRPQHTSRPLVVYESHVRGFTNAAEADDAGTFPSFARELARLAELGVSVVELLPVHQFDPAEGNYWGYMPLVFGAVHRNYGHGDRPAHELADLVAAAHAVDIEIWLDVVVNHTTEEDVHGPTFNLRDLANRDYYVVRDDGTYVDEAGCGNIIDATSPPAQELVLAGLDRLADLGVDGFRFDLAAVLARDPQFVEAIGDWAERRGVRLIAEPWDLARYLLGRSFPDERWAQWNGRFRDDMRGFLRGEDGLVSTVMQRLQGSPDLFDSTAQSINFLTSHDGFTMYDLVSYDRKHNAANGWNGSDGTDDNRSWNSGWEGDEGVPAEVASLRRRQMRNAMCLLMLSQGTPMFVAGDEFARTQGGNNNPYNQDNETSWVQWSRRDEFAEHERFVRRLIEFRGAHPVLTQRAPWGDAIEWYGASGSPDVGPHSRSLAWHVDGLYVMANMWWEPLDFTVQVPGDWTVAIDTTVVPGFAAGTEAPGSVVRVGPRSIVVLTQR